MKSYIILSHLADKFELKLKKYAQSSIMEVDSTNVTLSVRPVVNKVLTNYNFAILVQNIIQNIVNKASDMNKILHGDLKIDTFITNASLGKTGWKIDPMTSGMKATGSLLNDNLTSSSLKTLLNKINIVIINDLNKEFNRVASNWSGNKITDHETMINEVTITI